MLVLVLGVISLVLSITTAIGNAGGEGTHRAKWESHKQGDGVPSFLHVMWFFFSIVAVCVGYVMMATG